MGGGSQGTRREDTFTPPAWVCFFGSDVGDEGVTELRGTEVPGTPSLMFGCRNPQRKCVTDRRKGDTETERKSHRKRNLSF